MTRFWLVAVTVISMLVTSSDLLAQRRPNAGQDIQKVIPMRERVQIMQHFWDWKKGNVLPAIMREQGVDMWIVRSDEQPEYRQTSYKEGPFYTSLLPANHEGMVLASQYEEGSRIPEFLLFFDTGVEIEYVQPRDYAHIGELVRARDPRTIAISETNNEPMLKVLGEYASRAVNSWVLGVRWLETMGPEQISVYRYVQGVANDLIAEGFSNKAIIPDVTTVEDLNWWFRHRMLDLHIEKENHPTIGIQRKPANIEKYAAEDSPEFFRNGGRSDNGMNPTIRRGDIVSLDSDIMLLGMVTDSHQHAYVLEEGETDVPEELKEALRIVNRMQDRFAAEFQYGRTGIEIERAAPNVPAALHDQWPNVLSRNLGFRIGLGFRLQTPQSREQRAHTELQHVVCLRAAHTRGGRGLGRERRGARHRPDRSVHRGWAEVSGSRPA